MKDEIKNILKCLEMDMLDNKQIEKLLDYITNLQEENQRLNNIIDELYKWAEDYRFADILKNKLNELKGDNK